MGFKAQIMPELDEQRIEFDEHKARLEVSKEIRNLLHRREEALKRMELSTVSDIDNRLSIMKNLADNPKKLYTFIISTPTSEF